MQASQVLAAFFKNFVKPSFATIPTLFIGMTVMNSYVRLVVSTTIQQALKVS